MSVWDDDWAGGWPGREAQSPEPLVRPPSPAPRRDRGPGWGGVLAAALISSLIGGALGARWGADRALARIAATGVPVGSSAGTGAPAPGPGTPTADPAGGTGGAGSGGAPGGSHPGLPTAQVRVEFTSAISEAASKVGPAVVGIVNQVQQRRGYREVGTGSGVVFDRAQGLIVTNAHVVEVDRQLRPYQRLLVKTADDQTLEAELVGADSLTDLAVVRVREGVLPAQAEFGDSDQVKVGDLAIAIGNPLGLDFARSVTAGIISGLNRELPIETEDGVESTLQVIQTDAAINPGNSGGALVNAAGQVIGINSAKVAREGVEGLGFAIPVNFARPIIAQLVAHGEVVRPILGIRAFATRAQQQWSTGYTGEGLVVEVVPGGPADRAGLEDWDIILSVDGKPVNRLGELMVVLGNYQPGQTVQLRVRRIRGGEVQEFTVPVTLAGRAG
ncbi:MAG: trypsin-like peptidase domain-containing protein [Firmicutes bacterium]|nr:trypsin-like peptidase domain-containing protein [Bacillota bacterium]